MYFRKLSLEMFTTPKSLQKRTGKSDIDRATYFKQLLEEYNNFSTHEDKRLQILANFGNFAYDPINYEYIRRFNIIDIFINILNEFCNTEKIYSKSILEVNFSSGAICNLSIDPRNKEYLLRNNLTKLLIKCLVKIELRSNEEEKIIINVLMTLMFIFDETILKEFLFSDTIIKVYELSRSNVKQIANIANLFIQDYYQINI